MFSKNDQAVLKQLAQRVHEIAQLPEQQAKRELWRRHTALKHGIPPNIESKSQTSEPIWAKIAFAVSGISEESITAPIRITSRRL